MHPNPVEDGAEPSLDLETLRLRAKYALRALRRNAFIAIAVTLLVAAAGYLVAWLIPDRYVVETRLLSQRAQLIASLSNPGRTATVFDAGAERVVIGELVQRRDNLLSIVKQTGLLEHWRSTRPLLLRAKDYAAFGRRLSDEELLDVLVWTLEKRLQASADNGTITIKATWSDPVMAYRLDEAAFHNFVRMQSENEMAMLAESITLLEQRLVEAQGSLDEALTAAKALPGYGKSLAAIPAPTSGSPVARESVDKLRLRQEIAAKQRAIDDLVSFRDRRIAELQAQLSEQRAIYSDSHPVVANLRRSLEALSAEPPQLQELRGEISDLQGRYVQQGGSVAELIAGGPLPRAGGGASSSALLAALGAPARGPAEEYARSRLSAAILRYYNVADRLEAARIERDAAKVGDKFRYLVVKPPLPPRKSANGVLKQAIVVVFCLAAPFLGLLAAVVLELRRGRIVQRWQVERGLGLPVLAELPARLR